MKFHCAKNLNTTQIDYLVKLLNEIEYRNDYNYKHEVGYNCYLTALEL